MNAIATKNKARLAINKALITPAPVDNDWLAVSTEGFAQQNAGRPPAHLVKELVQNSLDALDGNKGTIKLTIMSGKPNGKIVIRCEDNGCGIEDLDNLRTVFWTSKQDSHLNRGRMGRGFKEMLCLALEATVQSNGRAINFITEDGKRKITRGTSGQKRGTVVHMTMPWEKSLIQTFEIYFGTFLFPDNITFTFNGKAVAHRKPKHIIPATLTTESFVDSKWVKPAYKTEIQLVECDSSEESFIYEMGIPVCPAEWDRRYHVNIMQRVPMNPNRDAVASGYPAKLHKACLPTLISEMKSDDLRKEWVGEIASGLDEDVQQQIIKKGWGENIVRSVPTMGDRRDHDSDAREIGRSIVKTQHLSSGFREIITRHVPTSLEAVRTFEADRVRQAVTAAFTPQEAFKSQDRKYAIQRELIEKVGGKARVEKVMAFAQWFCNRLLETYDDMCSGVKVAPLLDGSQTNTRFGTPAVATWSTANELTLGLDTPHLWKSPLGAETLEVLIHEAAHNRAHHHGDEFHHELEKLAGVAARVMLVHGNEVRHNWGDLL